MAIKKRQQYEESESEQEEEYTYANDSQDEEVSIANITNALTDMLILDIG